MTGKQTAKALFWLGIVIMVVGVIANVNTLVHTLVHTLVYTINIQAIGDNIGAFVISIFSPLWQGGLLIGIAKVIDILGSKRN